MYVVFIFGNGLKLITFCVFRLKNHKKKMVPTLILVLLKIKKGYEHNDNSMIISKIPIEVNERSKKTLLSWDNLD